MKKVFAMLTVFMLAFSLTVPAFAYDFNGNNYADDVLLPNGTVIKLQDLWGDLGQPQMMLYQNSATGSIIMYIMDGNVHESNRGIVADGDVRYSTMVYDSQQRWVFTDSWQTQADYMIFFSKSDLRWVAKTLYWESSDTVRWEGDSNFRVPLLAEMVLELSEEELVKVTIPEMVGAMKVLVPCGVGLMALLVGLKLFGKRSLIFRS